jgi:D-glycero-D-manno-heptose 1,7-bisphosphate phosphatase
MNKAVFLDRDGIINYESGKYTCSANEFIINQGVGESIKLLKDNNFIVIVISNQAGISKGLYSNEDVLEMHIKLCQHLLDFETKIDDFYYCPHHDSITKCLCRKPNSLLFEKAIAVYDIDVKNSVMIGDNPRDIIPAEKLGIKGILVNPNTNIFEICKSIINS